MPGKGAARSGDIALNCADPMDTPTGVVVAAGTVLINKIPAAKEGDQIVGVDIHIVNIPSPGGPVPTPLPHPFAGLIDGETESTVKIMGMPAATIGSTASCNPPHIPQGGPFQKAPANKSTIKMGSANVFIGQKSGGKSGSGSASGINDGIFPLSLSTECSKTSDAKDGHYLNVGYFDKSGTQIRDCKYRLTDPNNETSHGHVSGDVARYGIDAGKYDIDLYDIISVKWSAQELSLGSKVYLEIETIGIDDGVEAIFEIYQRDSEKVDPLMGKILGTLVRDNKARAKWIYPVETEHNEGVYADSFSVPDYYYIVKLNGIRKRSGILQCTGEFEYVVLDNNDSPVEDQPYFLYLSDGTIRKGKTKSDGKVVEKDIPPGKAILEIADGYTDDTPAGRTTLIPGADESVNFEAPPSPCESGDYGSASQEAVNTHQMQCGSPVDENECRPKITILEFEDKLFRTESAVVLPEQEDSRAAQSDAERQVTPVGIIATCLRYAEEHLKDKILVTGHTDTAGDFDYNQKLSNWRAETVTALLSNNGKRWAKICTGWDRMKIRDYNQILAWLAGERSWDCHPGKIDDNDHVHATNRFRKAYNANGPGSTWAAKITEHGGSNSEETWEAYFNCYQEYIAKELGVSLSELRTLQQNLKFYTPNKWVGCNEYHPRVAQNLDSFPCDSNRRVEVMFIEPHDKMPPLGCATNTNSCNKDGCTLFKSNDVLRVMRAPMATAKPWSATWETPEDPATMGSIRQMCVAAPGLKAGTPVDVVVRQYVDDKHTFTAASIKGTSEDSNISIGFDAWYRANRVVDAGDMNKGDTFPNVSFDFVVESGGRKKISPKLSYSDHVFIKYTQEGEPLKNTDFELYTQWGSLPGQTDGEGVVDIDQIPPGGAQLFIDDFETEQ